jgi:hypothetical protein
MSSFQELKESISKKSDEQPSQMKKSLSENETVKYTDEITSSADFSILGFYR